MTPPSKSAEETCAIITVERRLTAVIKAEVPLSGIREAQISMRRKIAETITAVNIGRVGPSLTLWRPPVAGVLDLEAGLLVSQAFAPTGDLVPSHLPEGRAAHFQLVGGYEGIPGAWQVLFDWCADQKLSLAGLNWEIYESGDPSMPKTSLYALLTGGA